MKKTSLVLTIICVCLTWNFTFSQSEQTQVSSKVKIALRNTANELLLSNEDSTSLIMPVKEIAEGKFQISFEKNVSFEPVKIVSILKSSLSKANIERSYLVEVVQCTDKEVAYSYMISLDTEKTIVPCLDRTLPKQCYQIQVSFIDEELAYWKRIPFLYVLFLIFGIIVFYFLRKKKVMAKKSEFVGHEHKVIGSFLFFKDQNKLIKKSNEIVLSKKECELLEIFSDNINSVVKREELTKKVWEDNGVIVGRSLDTYISKLRKKLQDDATVKIINIHGVGYKLEITKS